MWTLCRRAALAIDLAILLLYPCISIGVLVASFITREDLLTRYGSPMLMGTVITILLTYGLSVIAFRGDTSLLLKDPKRLDGLFNVIGKLLKVNKVLLVINVIFSIFHLF